MNCLVVDDEVIFRELIKDMISLYPTLNLIGECEDAVSAYHEITSQQIDLLFLDIKLPRMSGLELAKILEGKQTLIIMVTSEPDHALEAYNLNIIDYIVKPITLSRFSQAIEKAKTLFEANHSAKPIANGEFIFIRDSYTIRKIKLDEILYLEAKSNYVSIYVSNQVYSIHSSISTIAQKLPNNIFVRVHRSFLININKVDTIEGKSLIINKAIIPVSDAYRGDLNKRIQIL
jgi:two-component system LytT family response regulator